MTVVLEKKTTTKTKRVVLGYVDGSNTYREYLLPLYMTILQLADLTVMLEYRGSVILSVKVVTV